MASATNGITTKHSYNGDGVLVKSGTTAYSQDLANPLPQILQIESSDYVYGAERLVERSSSGGVWYVSDGLGSVRLSTNDAGTALGSIDYDPWGRVQRGIVPRFGYTGELQDGANVYLRARWYNTANGTFTAQRWRADESWHTSPYSHHDYAYALSNPVSLTDPTGQYSVDDGGVSMCPAGTKWNHRTRACNGFGIGGGGGGSWDDTQTSGGAVIPVRPPAAPPTVPEPKAPLGPGMPFEPKPVPAPAAPRITLPPIPIYCTIPILLLTQEQIRQQRLDVVRFQRTLVKAQIERELERQSNPNAPDNNQPHWVVRGGIATAEQLQRGTAEHRGVSGLYGFSVQHEPGKTIPELAAAGKIRNKQISVTTPEALQAAASAVFYPVNLVRSPGIGYHYTVQVPYPLPDDLAEALSIAFVQIPNPAPYTGP